VLPSALPGKQQEPGGALIRGCNLLPPPGKQRGLLSFSERCLAVHCTCVCVLAQGSNWVQRRLHLIYSWFTPGLRLFCAWITPGEMMPAADQQETRCSAH
jgi:hypothetical protein